jgi:hypothetical protein
LFGDVVGFDSKIVLLRHAFQFPLFDHNNWDSYEHNNIHK